MVAAGSPMARMVPIWRTSFSRVPRITKRRFSRAITINTRLTNTRAIATRPSLITVISRIRVMVTACPFWGRSASDS